MEINRIYCADNADFMKENIPSNFIDLTVTSPPYDNLRAYNGYSWDFECVAKELYRITKDGGVVVWVVGDATIKGSETGTSFKQALYFKEIGFNLHDTMIWNKGNAPFQNKNRYVNCFEYMFVLSKGKPKTHNLIQDKKNKWAGTQVHGTERQVNGLTKKMSVFQKRKQIKEFGNRLNIWELSPVKNNTTNHPAPFPEQLAADHITTWSNRRDLVFDPFCGSGTTCKMAVLNSRNYLGIEISQEYCDIANERIAQISRRGNK